MEELVTRLYLSKGADKCLYIDCRNLLPQHQIDGIRFLYRQYHKRVPGQESGAILNDPSGYGKRVQTVLFLEAMRTVLNKPTLVLCPDSNIDIWKNHFMKMTSYTDELAIESPNPFAKKLIFIKSTKDALKFCRRSWNMVIIDDSTFTKDILQVSFKADFKIWITSVSMKKNLSIFSSIYSWINAKNKFSLNDIMNNPKEDLDNEIYLETLFEEVVKEGPFNSQNKKINVPEMPPKRRKNKDPTGTKVKKTKRKIIIDDDDDEVDEIPFVNQQSSTNKRKPTNNKKINIFSTNNELDDTINIKNKSTEDNNEMDIESFIRNEEPIQSNRFKDIAPNILEEDAPKTEENFTMDFQNALNDVVANENTKENEGTDEAATDALIYDQDTEPYDIEEIDIGESNKNHDSFSIRKDSPIKQENLALSVQGNGESTSKDCSIINKNNSNSDMNVEQCETLRDTKADKPNKVQNSIEDQLADLEEKTLKMFKGTLLDRLF